MGRSPRLRRSGRPSAFSRETNPMIREAIDAVVSGRSLGMDDASKDQVLDALGMHIVAESLLTGTHGR